MLPRNDPEASYILEEWLTQEGVEFRGSTVLDKVERADGGIRMVVASGNEILGDALPVAMGRRPNTANLGLEEARVAYINAGIQVDDQLRTYQKHIYAAGDCIGSFQFTHYAAWQGVMAALMVREYLERAGHASRGPIESEAGV